MPEFVRHIDWKDYVAWVRAGSKRDATGAPIFTSKDSKESDLVFPEVTASGWRISHRHLDEWHVQTLVTGPGGHPSHSFIWRAGS